MQSGVCLRPDTVTLPELLEQHRIREKEEEELHGLASEPMAESEMKCTAPGMNTLKQGCVSANGRVSDLHCMPASLIKTETDSSPESSEDLIKTESLDSTELGYVTHLHPERVKMETDDGGNLKSEQTSDEQDSKCVLIPCDQVKSESTVNLVSELMNTVMKEVGANHKDLRIGASKKRYKCSYCGKCFSCVTHLNTHHRVHTNEKPYRCTHCGKFFRNVSNLNSHMRIHAGEKPHRCKHCGKCFLRSTHLKEHLNTHTDEKPFKCIQCGKGFSRTSRLNTHHRMHTGEKPFMCSLCGRRFCQPAHLIRHQRIHTGEKPYKCSHCGRCFGQRAHLIRHQKIHTGEKPYKCSNCGRCFIQQGHLKQHQRIHSGEKPY